MAELVSRRGLLLAAPALFVTRHALAGLTPTPRAAEGPFYPVQIPLDDDNDLILAEPAVRQAAGDILQLSGTVTGVDGDALASARVEIWQCDARGIYNHPGDRRFASRDAGFQGFGHATTDARGRFAFRTIVPVPYPGRTPHIHLKVLVGGEVRLTTQFYRAGLEQNERDSLFRRLSPEERERASMDVKRHRDGALQQYEAEVDVVLR